MAFAIPGWPMSARRRQELDEFQQEEARLRARFEQEAEQHRLKIERGDRTAD